MKRKNIQVYKLTHTYLKDNEDIVIKTEMKEKDLLKLIKVLQRKAVNIEETFDLHPSEMRDVLLQYKGIRCYPNDDDIKEIKSKGEDAFDYIEIDLYNVWESSDIVVEDYELVDIKYENKNVMEMIKDYIEENNYQIKLESTKK